MHAFEAEVVFGVFRYGRCEVAAGADLAQGLCDDGPPVLEDLLSRALLGGEEHAVLCMNRLLICTLLCVEIEKAKALISIQCGLLWKVPL